MARVERARQHITDQAPAPPTCSGSDAYWESVFEANAAAVLNALDGVRLAPSLAVRYRFFGRQGGDLLVRPFVAGVATDVHVIRHVIDWHPPPDSVASSRSGLPTRDVELLYRHFAFEPTPVGYFEYWVAMQELWGSARWVHSRIIADGEQFTALTCDDTWHIAHPVERFEPAVVIDARGGAQLAVLLHCPLERQTIALHRVQIERDHAIHFVDAIPVALGPRGYMM